MPPVKGGKPTTVRPLRKQLLLLADLLHPSPTEKATYRKLERLAGLTAGSLKDGVKRQSVSKPVWRKLLGAAERYGVTGLSLEWLELGLGDPPVRGGDLPPGRPVGARSAAEPTGVDPVGSPGGVDATQPIGGTALARQAVIGTLEAWMAFANDIAEATAKLVQLEELHTRAGVRALMRAFEAAAAALQSEYPAAARAAQRTADRVLEFAMQSREEQ